MEERDVRILDDEWQRLVNEYREARRQARTNGAGRTELASLDDRHTFLVDSAYARLKYAETRAAWQRRASECQGFCRL